MKRSVRWLWRRGVVSTFLAGFFVLLPVVITISLMIWAGTWIRVMVGPGTLVGRFLQDAGLRVVSDERLAPIVGWILVLALIWSIGFAATTFARNRMEKSIARVIDHVPLIRTIYKPVSQVVEMLRGDDGRGELSAMKVVYCSLGASETGGLLGLSASEDLFRFRGRECVVVYVPTSPVPMSGGILFLPRESVVPVEMSVDDLIKIYFSLGMLAPRVVPPRYRPHNTAPPSPDLADS